MNDHNFFVNKTILIISPEPWGQNHISKHHYASMLSQMGNKVYFLNPPRVKVAYEVVRIANNLFEINYPLSFRGINKLPLFLSFFLQRSIAKKIRSICSIFDVVWSFDPFRFQNLDVFGAQLKIYHPVDIHSAKREITVAKRANLLFATSNKILERFTDLDTPCYKINHGLSDHFMVSHNKVINFLKDQTKINVGYVGNLNYKYLDKNLLLNIVNQNKNCDFYFIGPYEKSNLSDGNHDIKFIENLAGLENSVLLGPKNSLDLPVYLSAFDIFLMCYKGDDNVSQLANPHKLLEYVSTGKPVVTHYIDEYKDTGNLILMAKKNADIPKLFKESLKNLDDYNNEDLQRKRKEFARNNSYRNHIRKIEHIIHENMN